ncbi:MAG TPA: chromosome segregation protein SMC [Thermoplasmatales archaeon]|nr:chromosome segregation protein SMC [Thermoplasmatales archaeon]
MGRMYLKEVQLENFKSFGKKITVPFLPGFTAITGPNGAGKSNISDAILFVLGPRSPKIIRAGRLTDLIYNGKKSVDHCKVSLVFENGGEEVVLTRRIKRAPLPDNPDNYYSYFYINGRSSSLSDFVHFLSSNNVSANSIVQQGDVTAIVEMGDVPRRRILDDIAGISDFDRDIEKSEREREEVEKNLEYMAIILNEIKSQLGKLKKERDGAIQYKELRDRLQTARAMLSYKKRREVEKEIAEIQKQIQKYQQERQDLEQETKRLRDTYRQKQLDLQALEEKIAELGGEEVEELKEKIDHAREESIKAKEKINYYTRELVEGKDQRKELTGQRDRLARELASYGKKIAGLEKEVERLTGQLEEKQRELEELKETVSHSDQRAMDITRELAKIKKQYEEERAALHELELKKDRLLQQMDALALAISELEENRGTYEFELKDVEWQIQEIGKQAKQQRHDKKRLEQELFDRKKEEAEIAEALQKMDREVMQYQRELARLRAKEDAASYTRATREILKARDEGAIKGIHGSISELGQVDEDHRMALGVAAGSRAEAIVVDDDEVAAACISFLKKNDYGRTTFLPLNKMVGGKPRGKALMTVKEKGAVGFAIDLVHFDPAYQPAFWYVFRDTIVMENLQSARAVMGGVRLVTLGGDIIESTGAMVGGSAPRLSSFGDVDRRKVGEIGQKLREVSHQQEVLSEKLLEVRERLAAVEKELRECAREEDDRVERLELRRKEFTGKLEVITQELAKKAAERDQVEQKLAEVEKVMQEKNALMQKLEKERHATEQGLKKISKKEVMDRMDRLREEIQALKEQKRDLSSQIQTAGKERDMVAERQQEIEAGLAAIERQQEDHQREIRELQEVHAQHRDQMEALMEVEKKMLGKMKGLTKERDELYRESVDIENKIDTLATKMETHLDLVSRAQSRLPTLEQTLAELLMETEGLEFKDQKLPPVDDLKADIKSIEQKMEGLQPVNMRALEEYERQDERRKEFDQDIDRLKEQRKNLIHLVEEIKKKKTDAFMVVFEEVKQHFERIYTHLMEGGDAQLILENPEQPFDGGLIIKARPKGKRALRLNALSGGEKSMASLAFIFALQAYDPSPFYILDEVDMFLDGKNAERVATMVSQQSRRTQFIMISLRRITLNKADHIYGVTMQDGDVSTMIGNVNMEQVEQIVEVK